MIFDQITIENLFSYYGPVTFAGLYSEDPQKNLIIIRGRNGRGKTSFLRAVKLLFTGISDQLREEASVYRKLSPGQYFRGDALWQGMRNRFAVEAGKDRYAVTAQLWTGPDLIEIERTWDREGDETLRITGPDGTLRDEAAQSWLHDRVPAYAVPYFFFDGELVQRVVAEQRAEVPDAIRRLFGLEPLIDLSEKVKEVTRVWARESGDEQTRRALDLVDQQVMLKTIEISHHEQAMATLRDDLEQREDELARVDEQLARLASRGTEAEFARLEQTEKQAKEELKRISRQILKEEVPWAPLWTNADLVGRVQARLTTMLQRPKDAVEAEQRALRAMQEDLPTYLVDHAPRDLAFSAGQQDYLRRSIRSYVELKMPDQRTEQDWALGEDAARQVLYTLQQAAERKFAALLTERQRVATDVERCAAQRRNFEHLSADETREKDRLTTLRDRLLVELARANDHEKELGSKLQGCRQEHTRLHQERERLNVQLEHESRAQARVAISKGVRDLLPALADALARARLRTLSEGMNERFELLFSSTTQVGRCYLTESFEIACDDRQGQSVARGSLSAGTQQMMAMALLWTLTNEIPFELPVVVTHLLARLDARHRSSVAHWYLPKANRQMIILSTDAELESVPLSSIRTYVHRAWELENPTGGRTQLKPLDIS